MKKQNPWKQLSRETIHSNKFGYRVHIDQVITPAGTPGEYMVVEKMPGYTTIVAITKDQKVVFVNQWRYTSGELILELPAGGIDVDEEPLEAAKRELLEETGASSRKWISLGWHWTGNGVMRMKGYDFLALDAEFTNSTTHEEEEAIEIDIIEFKNAVRMINKGEIVEERTILGLLLAKNYFEENS